MSDEPCAIKFYWIRELYYPFCLCWGYCFVHFITITFCHYSIYDFFISQNLSLGSLFFYLLHFCVFFFSWNFKFFLIHEICIDFSSYEIDESSKYVIFIYRSNYMKIFARVLPDYGKMFFFKLHWKIRECSK